MKSAPSPTPIASSFLSIWNMSFGFFGIQFGWGLQMGNMSSIYEYLGASESALPLLWLAAPITGLIIQPIIGHFSDRTWHPILGRRRPYFLVGAILASLSLFLMPRSSALWMAAGLLWILDASVNVSMEPFRAFVADLLPERQRTVGFAMQSVFIGAGAVLASKLPGWLHSQFGIISTSSPEHPIPQTVHLAFTIGAVVFLLSVLWTIVTTKETPPSDPNEFKKLQNEGMGEIATAIRSMPGTMRQLASVQFFTWMALFCMWIFFPVAVARDLLGAAGPQDPLYPQGVTLANDSFAIYNLVAFFAAMAFLYLGRKFSARTIHTVSLLLGGIGLASVGLLPRGDNLSLLLGICFAGVGIAWASILSMPYAMLSASIPSSKMGVYMGIFNLFIVLPQILIAVIVSRAMEFFPQIHRLNVVTFGGACLILAAFLTLRIQQARD